MKIENAFHSLFLKISLQGVMCCAGSFWNKEKSTCESNSFPNMSFRICPMYSKVF